MSAYPFASGSILPRLRASVFLFFPCGNCILPYFRRDSKPLNVQKKRWNFGTFLCIIHQRNKSPCAALCGAFVGKGKPTRRKQNYAGQGNTAAVRAAAPFGALVLGYGFWITVRSGTPNRCPSPLSLRDISPPRGESPIQIRRRFRTPHRKGHRHRFPFP